MSRFMYWAPWHIFDWWKPRIDFCRDMWGNESIEFVVPPLGCFVFFWEELIR